MSSASAAARGQQCWNRSGSSSCFLAPWQQLRLVLCAVSHGMDVSAVVNRHVPGASSCQQPQQHCHQQQHTAAVVRSPVCRQQQTQQSTDCALHSISQPVTMTVALPISTQQWCPALAVTPLLCFCRFHRILLSWDYYALCQRAEEGKGVYDTLRSVPNTFASIQVCTRCHSSRRTAPGSKSTLVQLSTHSRAHLMGCQRSGCAC